MYRRNLLVLASLGVLLLVASFALNCNNRGTDPVDPEPGVSGKVGFITEGGITDFPEVTPYYEATGRFAKMTFTNQATSEAASAHSDENSRYSIELEPGTYTMMVESAHSWPRFWQQVVVSGNTRIDIPIYLEFDLIDSVIVAFEYTTVGPGSSDPFTPEVEIGLLRSLNQNVGNLLRVEEARNVVISTDDEPPSHIVSSYYIPVANRHYTWEVFAAVSVELRYQPGKYPLQMKLSNTLRSMDRYDLDDNRIEGEWNWPGGNGSYTPPEPIINVWPDDFVYLDIDDFFRYNPADSAGDPEGVVWMEGFGDRYSEALKLKSGRNGDAHAPQQAARPIIIIYPTNGDTTGGGGDPDSIPCDTCDNGVGD